MTTGIRNSSSPSSTLVDAAFHSLEEVGNDQVLVLDAASEVDFVTPDEVKCDSLTLPKADFEVRASLFPTYFSGSDVPVGPFWRRKTNTAEDVIMFRQSPVHKTLSKLSYDSER